MRRIRELLRLKRTHPGLPMKKGRAGTVGFVGVLLLLRPGLSMDVAALAAVLGAVFMALVVIMVAKLGRSESYLTVMLYFGIVSSAIAVAPAALVWRQPDLRELGLLVAMGACGVAAQTMALRGFAIGEATVLVNFEYLQLLNAIVYGFVAFGAVPDAWTIAGSLIIVLTAAYVARREARSRPTPARSAVVSYEKA